MNAGFDEDEAEFRVFVFPVGLEVLSHGDRLFDEVPEVLWDGRCQSYPQTKRQKTRMAACREREMRMARQSPSQSEQHEWPMQREDGVMTHREI